MADLYHLLDELQEREEEEERREHYGRGNDDDADDADEEDATAATSAATKRKTNDNRRLTVETAATAEMSYEGDDDDDDDDDDDGFEDDFGSSPQNYGSAPIVPEALRRLRQEEEEEENEGDDNNNNNGGGGGGIEDLLEEEEFDKFGSTFKTGGGFSKSKTNKSSSSSFFLQDEQDQIDVQQEAQTLGEMYGLLHRQWLEEQHSPELLPIDTNLVGELKSKIEMKQDELDDKTSQASLTGDSQAVHLLMADIEQQDLDRAKFVLADYLTMRLQKIESFALFYYKSNQKSSKQQQQQQQKQRERMSPVEIKYLEQYWALEKQLLEMTVTDHMPSDLPQWKKLDSRKMVDEPDTTGYNFWVVQDEPMVLDDEIHEEHSCLIAKYSKMKHHMDDGKVRLLL